LSHVHHYYNNQITMFENSLRFLKTAIMELADYLLYVI
jgi:hypothetical protein